MSKYQIGLISLLLTFILMGCTIDEPPNPTATSEPPPTSTPVPTATEEPKTTRLNLAYGNLPTTLDPHRTSDQFAADVLRFICQRLITLGDSPLLAEKWEYAPDNLSVTFTLREGIEFRDGTPFDAEAVRYSFERLQQPESEESPIYEDFQNVKIETPDTRTVVFKFDEPRNDFIDVIESDYALIISPSSDEAQIGANPICTGPYQVKQWEPDQFILLTKNPTHTSVPEYFDNKGPAHIDEIKMYRIETHEERIQALLEGTLDANHLNTKEELEIFKERADTFKITEINWLGGITYLGFNYDRSPTNELAVRQALAHTINKEALIDRVLADEFAIPAVSLLSPRTFGYSDELEDVEYKFDLERSRQLLAEAGFVDNDGDGILERNGQPLKLKLLTTTDNIYLDMATPIQQQLAELGVVVEIQQAPRTEISKITPTGEFDLLLYDYNWPYPSALNLFLSSERISSTNRVAYSNPEVDNLLAELNALEENQENEDIRLEKIIQIQRIIIQDVPWQPILARRTVSAMNKRVVGEKTHEKGSLLWHDAKIVEE